MISTNKFRRFAFSGLGLSLTLAAGLLLLGQAPNSKIELISSADARIGRPLTPVSYAGVARRTTRRAVVYGGAAVGAAAVAVAATPVVVQSTTYVQPAPAGPSVVASPPQGCPPEGDVFVCGGYAYQPVMQGSTVVYAVHVAN